MLLNINKPEGITSFAVVSKIRKLLNIKQVGHAGTLDPIASGVLPVFVSKSTRLIQYIPKTKSYRATMILGIRTNTFDKEGEIISKVSPNTSEEEIISALKTFEGDIDQVPPKFSAIKMNGKKLYEYARKNIDIGEIPSRKVKIDKITFISKENEKVIFDIDCQSGVYVRSIINDLGEKLGCGAMMQELVRTRSANLLLKNSVKLEDLTSENIKDYFISPRDIIEFPEIILTEQEFEKINFGQYIDKNIIARDNDLFKLIYNDKLIGIAYAKDNLLYPKTVITTGETL